MMTKAGKQSRALKKYIFFLFPATSTHIINKITEHNVLEP